MQTKNYISNNFTVKATPMTRLEFALTHENYRRYKQPLTDKEKAWDSLKGFEVNWNGWKFWKSVDEFHKHFNEIETPIKSAIVTEIKSYTIENIYEYIDKDENYSDDEIVDILLENVRHWDIDQNEDGISNYNFDRTILIHEEIL